MKTQLITINPWFYTKTGHNHIYLKSVEKSSKFLGWSFLALLPQKNIVDNLPENWIKCIDCPTVRHWFEQIEKKPYKRDRKFFRAKQRVRYYFSLFFSLKKNFIKGKNILLFETFAPSDIILITHLLTFLPKKNTEVWLLYRYPSSFMKDAGQMDSYKKCHKRIEAKGITLKLVTDSDLLNEDLSAAFTAGVHTFPIPHVEDLEAKTNKISPHIDCWWPGLARPGKGQKIIQDFASSSHPKNALFNILAAKNSGLTSTSNGPNISLLEKELSREDYVKYLINSDLILLPYVDSCYQKTTSGIFTETIMAGKIPVVYPNTWMAYELCKFDLKELIINWEKETLPEKLLEIYQDSTIKEKISLMRGKYLEFHSINNFSEEMKKLLAKEYSNEN